MSCTVCADRGDPPRHLQRRQALRLSRPRRLWRRGFLHPLHTGLSGDTVTKTLKQSEARSALAKSTHKGVK